MAFSTEIKNLIRLANNNDWGSFDAAYRAEFAGATDADVGSAFAAFNAMDPSSSKGSASGGGRSIIPSGEPKGIVDWIQKFLETQEQSVSGEQGEFITIQKGIDTFFDSKGKFRGVLGSLKEMAKVIPEQIVVGLQQTSNLLTEMNTKAGMTGDLSREFRQEIMAASPEVIRLGISFNEMMESVSGVLQESGRFKLLGRETIEELALVSKFTDGMSQFASMGKGFEEIGLGIMDMTREVDKAGHSSLVLGLNARRTTKDINEHLSKLNQYGFRNGIEGLTKMSQIATEFRMDMNQAFALADKVWSPEGALEVVSNLQVIGGAFGDLNDPIKLMYMATNNVEGLQEALIGASKTLVTFNNEQGRFEITGANLRRAKEMADTMGVSYQELTKGAIAAMERTQAASDLMSRGIDMDSEDREFLTNLSQMREGKMVIEVPEDLQDKLGGDVVELANMSEEQTKLLLDNREQFKVMSTEDIARQQYTAIDNIRHDVSFITAKARVGIGKELGDAIETFISPDLNQASISEQSKKLFDSIGGFMDKSQTWVSDAIKDSKLGPLVGDRKSKGTLESGATSTNIPPDQKTKESKTTPPKQSSDLNINFTSDVNSDAYRLAVQNSPEMLAKIKNSYFDAFAIK